MKQHYTLLLLFLTGLLFTGCTSDELDNPLDVQLQQRLSQISPTGDLTGFALPSSNDLAAIPQDPHNPLTPDKVQLGKMLFFETGLALDPVHESGRETYSCGSCHVPSSGFMAGREQGIADGGMRFGTLGEGRTKNPSYADLELDAQGVRPLCMFNVAYVSNTTWNGRFGSGGANVGTEHAWEGQTEVNHLGYSGLETQNIEGLKLHRMVVNEDVVDSLRYRPLFDAAFSDVPEEERYSLETASFAISAYLRTLITDRAPFQRWVRGNQNAMTDAEKRGALLFFGKANCFSCHKGPALNAVEFYAIGVNDLHATGNAFATSADDPRNLGRGQFTGWEEDMYKFKVPQLYNLKDAAFLFHGSSKKNLEEVVQYFNEGLPENLNVPIEQISPKFRALYLSESEQKDLLEFLQHSLYDPDINRHVPNEVLSGNCFPNNDPDSREDLGCE
jgi:cytochrome c peroxidase